MTAVEWGTLDAAPPDAAGDAVLADGYQRSFITASPAGFPQVVTIAAIPALVSSGDDPADPTAPRDLLEVCTVDTYLHGVDLGAGDADPFDSETAYTWPVDYWPPSTRDAVTGEPTLEALDASARAHVEHLSSAWIDALPDPPAGLLLPS